jgi:hypothetical protein
MPCFQHVDSTGRLQFWIADSEVTVTADPVEIDDPALIRALDSCPFVKRVDKPSKKEAGE